MIFPRRRRRHAIQILHIYGETEEEAGAAISGDGQRIMTVIATCKVRCTCGAIMLRHVTLAK